MKKKEHLQAMLEALIKDDTDEANKHLHDYLSMKTNEVILGEKDDDKDDSDDDDKKDSDDDKDDDDDDDDNGDDDKDDDDDDDDDKKGKFPFNKKKGKDDVKEESLSHPASYKKNEKGDAYHAVPHKDDSEGYGHNKSRSMSRKGLKDIPGGKESGSKTGLPDSYKTKPHKDNSRGAKSENKGSKGLKQVSGNSKSPYSDGKKVNRRTDKTAKYHGDDRGGKSV